MERHFFNTKDTKEAQGTQSETMLLLVFLVLSLVFLVLFFVALDVLSI